MDKLVITVTVDSTASYPGNPRMPDITDVRAVADEYIAAVDAGASIVHHHGVHHLEDAFAADGRKLSRVDHEGWRDLTKLIRGGSSPVMQFGIASARMDEKIRLFELEPDMMSYAFNAHDEHFQPDPAYPANDIYGLHPRDELEEFCRAARSAGIKPEIECFYTGAYWNLEFIRNLGLLDDPIWTTLFFGWPGGTWTPPTPDALLYMVRHLPAGANWNVSVMNPAAQWQLLPLAIATGGHVRVGWEDNPYLPDGSQSRSNAELVEVVVGMARSIGREVATPEEARQIIGLPARSVVRPQLAGERA